MEENRAIRWTIMIPANQVERMKYIAEMLGISLSDFVRNVGLNEEKFTVFGSKNYNSACTFLKNNLSAIEKNLRQIESRHQLDSNVWNRYDSFRKSIRERFIDLRRKVQMDIPKTNDGEKKRIFLMVTSDENECIKANKTDIISRLSKSVFVYDVDASQWDMLQKTVNRVGKEVNQIAYLSNAGRWDQVNMNDRLREVLHSI